jgi:DNA-binding MarR family transcriptional regulator
LRSQVSPLQQISVPPAWVHFLRGHSSITRQLNVELLAEHDLTLNDYEVLLHLVRAPERALRRVDLAERVLLTPSGITRLLDGLERAGYVEKRACELDGRVSYAVLTDAGYKKLAAASTTHLDGVARLFAARFSSDELETLAALLGRLSDGNEEPGQCGVSLPSDS